MFVELTDHLRCPGPHEGTWLVLAAHDVRDRQVMRGTLGCHVCRAEYPVADGEARFAPATPDEPGAAPYAAADGDGAHAERLAALLGLGDAGGWVLLAGAHARAASALAALVDVRPVLLNPPPGVEPGAVSSVLRVGDILPLAAGSMRGAALDGPHATPALLAQAARAVRAGGRLVAPADVGLPAGAAELARDAHEWVAEVEAAAGAPVPLGRAGGAGRR